MSEDGQYTVGSTEVSTTDRDFLRSISIDADEQDRLFPSVTDAFRFCFALGIAHDGRCEPGRPLTSIAPRQFLPEDYLDILLPIAQETSRSLGGIASEFGCYGIALVRERIDDGESVFDLVGEVLQ